MRLVASLTGLLVLLLLTAGCVGSSSRRVCVDSASSNGNQAVIQAEGGTFQYSDPSGLVNANWKGKGMYVITVDNNVITQTLKAFNSDGSCPFLGS